MRPPDFLIVGAAKSGTTALYQYLSKHPQIFMSPVKEPNFFTFAGGIPEFGGPPSPLPERSVVEASEYRTLFASATGRQICGEASPTYLYYQHVPQCIFSHNRDSKIIAILRNPADRAYSNYLFLRRDNREFLSNFRDALEAETDRIKENWEFIWHYVQLGFYGKQLKRYYDVFPRARIKVFLYDDFQRLPQAVLRDVFEFLEVDPGFEPRMDITPNLSGIPKSRLLHRTLSKPSIEMTISKYLLPSALRKQVKQALMKKNLRRPSMPPMDREYLIGIYREDILFLQDLIGRDLSLWLRD